jgi:hypothetical protein
LVGTKEAIQIKFDQWFPPGTPVSSTNKTDRHDVAEILLKVALNTIKQTSNITTGKNVQLKRQSRYNL